MTSPTPSPDRLEELEKIARAATSGPWYRIADAGHPANRRITSDSRPHVGKVYGTHLGDERDGEANAAHIAAFDPPQCLELLALIRAQAEKIAELPLPTPAPAEGEKTKPWPLIGYAPGGYNSKCSVCGRVFVGAKRAFNCLECAASRANELLAACPTPPVAGEVAEVIERLREMAAKMERGIVTIWPHPLNEAADLLSRLSVDGGQAKAQGEG